jgi:hypothetical protein
MIDRISEEVFDAFLLENVGDRWPGLHGRSFPMLSS